MFKLKHPAVREISYKLAPGQLASDQKSSVQVITNVDAHSSSIIGIITVVTFILLTFFTYYTARKSLEIPRKMTLSEAFQYSNRHICVPLLLLFTILIIYSLIEKGFISPHSSPLKKSLAGVSFAVLTFFMLLFIVPPSKEEFRKHAFVAIFCMTFIIFSAVSLATIYADIYENTGLISDMQNIAWGICAFSGLILISFVLRFSNFASITFTSFLTAISEIIILILYTSLLGILTVMPEMYDISYNNCPGIIT